MPINNHLVKLLAYIISLIKTRPNIYWLREAVVRIMSYPKVFSNNQVAIILMHDLDELEEKFKFLEGFKVNDQSKNRVK